MKVFLFKAILALGRVLSLSAGRRFASVFGWLFWLLSKKNKKITLTNIRKCFPEKSESHQKQLAKACINATLMNFMELGRIWDKNKSVDDLVDNIYGVEEFQSALKQGKGLLLAAPHFGNWEVVNLVLARFEKFAFLYKAPDDEKIEQLLIESRGKSEALQIEASPKGVKKILLHLKDQGFIAILPDQRPKSGQGIFVPFYNIPTYTMTLFPKLAVKTQVPVFFVYALRKAKGFDVYFEKSSDEIYGDIEQSATYMNAHIQKIVDKAPEQYQWTYKRFSIQPENEPPFYQ